MTYHCHDKECAKRFRNAKTETVLGGSKFGFRVWMIATYYLLSTILKSVSSIKFCRDLNINHRASWFLAHRPRVELDDKRGMFAGPIEVDDTCFGDHRKNNINTKRKELTGRGKIGMTAVVGAKVRKTNKVSVKMVRSTDKPMLQGFVADHTAEGTAVYTDNATAYEGMPFNHETVTNSLSEYVRDNVHTNGIQPLWSMMKWAYKGAFHKINSKYLDHYHYVQEFAARHNLCERDTIKIMALVIEGGISKMLRYNLIANNRLSNMVVS